MLCFGGESSVSRVTTTSTDGFQRETERLVTQGRREERGARGIASLPREGGVPHPHPGKGFPPARVAKGKVKGSECVQSG